MDMKEIVPKGQSEGSTSSRRDFLKLTGAGLAGAFAAVTLGCTTMETRDGRKVTVYATSSGAIVHEPNLCVGCRRCEAACTVRNDGKSSAYISRIKVSRNLQYGARGVTASYGSGDGQMGNFFVVADTCRQCEKPPCGLACPVGAITADKKTGARVVNADVCVGCGACEQACPWKIATLDKETKVSTKCLLCDGDPNCVKTCPTGAIAFYTWDKAKDLLFGPDATSGATDPDAITGATA